MRGCGDSEGERGRIICLDQVGTRATRCRIWQRRPEVDPERIALIGHSFGAAVAVYTGGADSRVAACVSCGGWGDGERKFREPAPSPPRNGRNSPPCSQRANAHREAGKSMMVPRYDIVPIPARLRTN